ncbi:MAG: DUF1127 domain-containing protein [Marinibacterium sp.]|nr:DUF1127 domain-containing protein [Marinibacterium sp.]
MAHVTFHAARRARKKHASLAELFALWRQRQHLRRLDDDALADIGLTRQDAEREAARPVWDAPERWRG